MDLASHWSTKAIKSLILLEHKAASDMPGGFQSSNQGHKAWATILLLLSSEQQASCQDLTLSKFPPGGVKSLTGSQYSQHLRMSAKAAMCCCFPPLIRLNPVSYQVTRLQQFSNYWEDHQGLWHVKRNHRSVSCYFIKFALFPYK